MKVLVQTIVNGEAGRKTWVVRTPEGKLVAGTTPVKEKQASVLTPEEVQELILGVPRGEFIVLRIVRSN